MKTSRLFTMAIGLLLFGGCAAPPPEQPAASATVGGNTREQPMERLKIVSATFGSGKHYVDVTPRVEELLRLRGDEFLVNATWLKIDPTPGWNKTLVLVYEVNGRRSTVTFVRNARVSRQILVERAQQQVP